MDCKYCGNSGSHYCFPTYCIEKLGRDCSKCSQVNCKAKKILEDKKKDRFDSVIEETKGKIVVED